ncbi:bifunctional glycosyltransferase/CDP-glycerol:glycerophosphate glycerophosphotransferase [Microlunatus speluncae]|uniref:bifunctional glycosyltransferase/CDP-glycerol:glycerophosphate glycerophosphotransferase n=1 Tax=Microlunatus speluncae TaxID=2594267 RepID=UPI001266151B|nr:CDP-glycerol glycerophosphotransferase family protein [Microlunatus speluncae]
MQARKLFSRIARRLPNRLVRAVKESPIGPMLWRRLPGPELSVIVPVYNVEDYLGACLNSLLRQTLKRLEIIIVDDGSTDGSAAVIAAYAAKDRRIRVIRQANAGLGAARNVGIAAATSPLITFLDSDDTIPQRAYQRMVDTLRRTGSEFVVGSVRRFSHGRSSTPAWVDNAHREERLKITIDEFPDAMQDVIACNRMFRRDFWNARVGPFPEGIAYEDHVPMVTAYLRATSFDLLSSTTYNWRIREDQTSIGQQKHQTANLRDRVSVKDQAWEVVTAEASPRVAAAWLGRVLDLDLSLFVEYGVTADEEYRAVLQRACQRFLARAGDAAWSQVRVERKLRVHLAAEGRWVDAGRVIEFFRLNGALPQTTVVDGLVLAELAIAAELDLPDELYRLSDHQSALSACIARTDWLPDGRLRIEGWAFARGVDLTEHDEEITAYLKDLTSGHRVPLEVGRFSRDYITRWANHPNQRYDSAGFTTVIDVDALVTDRDPAETRWQLRIRTSSRGVAREGAVHGLIRIGQGKMNAARELASGDVTYRIVPVCDPKAGFVLHIRPDRWRAVRLAATGRRLTGQVRLLRPGRPARELVLTRNAQQVVLAKLEPRPDGDYGFSVELPETLPPSSSWEVRVRDASRTERRLSWPAEAEVGTELGGFGPGSSRWTRTPRGYVTLSTAPVVLRAHAVAADGNRLLVDVTLSGADPSVLARAYLHAAKANVTTSSVEDLGTGRHRLVFESAASSWGSPTAYPLPAGSYGIRLPWQLDEDGADSTVNCLYDLAWLPELPYELVTERHRVTVARRVGSPVLTIGLRAPLAERELGRVAQRRLAAREWSEEPLEQVFFQCYRGEFATDSQLAIHQELRRRGTELDLVWGVSDLSVELPEGGRPVIIGSADWYEAIARSRHLCNNIDFDRFFRRRPFQRFLQTFHGYPFKSMGISFWRAKGFPEDLIDVECERRNAAWTSILVPSEFCAELYRREYRYEGEILVTGYPRSDALIDPDPGERARVLGRLGVDPAKKVILYAPTWRDTSATGAWTARFFDALDIERLAEELGDDYVILLRGHNYNLRHGDLEHLAATVLDVTRYPEINDLTLAADVAILDYSSLRFDWALTGKPMIFFVPDLDDYLGARSALYDWGPTAPGPQVRELPELVDWLLRLEVVEKEYRSDIARFNAEYNGLHDGSAGRRVVDANFSADVVAGR